ncbi:MAG: hypothetical protein J6T04_06720, partial [Bacteroidales bacterium]|nr:hypothetical protein [Bacteroidales bacterium]
VGAINKVLDQYKNWAFVLAFTSIGLDTNFRQIIKKMQGGKVLWLYVIGQLFNIALTFLAVWLLLSGKFFPVPELDNYNGKKAEPKVVEAPAPATVAADNAEALPADTISAAEALKAVENKAQ